MSNLQIIEVLNDLVATNTLGHKQRKAIAWAIAKLYLELSES